MSDRISLTGLNYVIVCIDEASDTQNFLQNA